MKIFQKHLQRRKKSLAPRDFGEKGFSVIEIMVALAVLLILFIAIADQFGGAMLATNRTAKQVRAGFILEEGVEVVQLLRSASYTGQVKALATSTPLYLNWTGASWAVTSTPDPIDGIFTRKIVLEEVFRDPNGDIETGSIDPSDTEDAGSRKLTVTVSWPTGSGTRSEQIVTYIMNIYKN